MSQHISPKLTVLANRYAAAWNSHDVDAIMALHADDTSYQMDGSNDVQRGKAEVAATFASQLAAVPDIAFELKSLYGGAEHIVFEARITGTRVDGKRLTLNGVDLITVRDGLVAAKHSYAVPAR
jgi:steroid delta-isomerase-like uncharacterized protein